MARIRTIKPTFFTSLTIADLTVEQRLTFIGLWTHVDDEGRCVYDPRLIKAALWPLDSRTAADIAEDIRALTESSLITHYVVGERSYLAVIGWAEHQRINRKVESKLPDPSEGEIRPLTCSDEDSRRTHGGLSESSLPEGKGRDGTGREEELLSDESDEPDLFDEFWKQYPRKEAKAAARRAWRTAVKKADPKEILDGLAAYAFSPDPQFRPLPASWINGQRWEDEASVHQIRPDGPRKQQVLVGEDRWRDVTGDEVTIGRKTRWVPA